METKVCKKCEESFPATTEYFRWINGKGRLEPNCKNCANERSRQLYEERHKGTKQEYYNDNIVEIKRKRAIARDGNRDTLRSIAREYGQRPEVKQRRLERKIANPNQSNESYNRYYNGKGRDRILAIVHRREARKNNSIATLTPEQWIETVNSFDSCCAYCGKEVEKPHEEHVIPTTAGGMYTKSNMIPSCKSCNSSKFNYEMEPWFRKQPFFSESRLKKIHKWIGFNEKSNTQQLALY